MHNGYFAVVLDEKSCDAVKKYSTMDVVNGDHITLAYKPDDRMFKKLKCLVGKKVDAYYNQIRANKNIEAYFIRDMYLTESYKKLKKITPGQAHITISHKKGYKPGDAKSMFDKPPMKFYFPTEMATGKVKWISYE
jgi:hypothetical protein